MIQVCLQERMKWTFGIIHCRCYLGKHTSSGRRFEQELALLETDSPLMEGNARGVQDSAEVMGITVSTQSQGASLCFVVTLAWGTWTSSPEGLPGCSQGHEVCWGRRHTPCFQSEAGSERSEHVRLCLCSPRCK